LEKGALISSKGKKRGGVAALRKLARERDGGTQVFPYFAAQRF